MVSLGSGRIDKTVFGDTRTAMGRSLERREAWSSPAVHIAYVVAQVDVLDVWIFFAVYKKSEQGRVNIGRDIETNPTWSDRTKK